MPKFKASPRQWLLAGTILTSLALGLPAMAQDTPPAPATTTEKTDAAQTAPAQASTATDSQEVVVTGSRIRKNEFTSPSPVQVITSEKSSLSGMVSATEVLQGSSIAAGAGQINNTFTGYVVDGGAGINTISLRGLGAQRSLVLLNGRRMPPAGVSGTVAAVDLNFIPQSLIQRYEILKDGASSIYGSDAVAGVVNIITVKNTDGVEIGTDISKTEAGGADEGSVYAMYGKTFDRGHFLLAGEYYKQTELTLGDRPDLSCPQDYYFKADGSRADRIDPATGKYKCYSATGLYQGVLFDALSGDIYYYKQGDNSSGIPNYPIYTSGRFVDFNPAESMNTSVFSPVSHYTLFGQGSYRPAWANGVEFYTELMYAERKSSQTEWGQLFPYYSPFASNSPLYGSSYAQPVVIHQFDASQNVKLGRVLGGARGEIGKWNWDSYLSYSKSDGRYDSTAIYADRVNWGTGLNQNTFDFMDNTTGDACGASAPAGCVPLNLFTADANTKGKLTPAEEAWYFTVDHGKTIYEQTIFETTLTGDLFQLPAGAVSTALGVSLRNDKIDDLPGALSRAGNSYNRASAGQTRGSDSLSEVFGEVEVPVVRGKPLFEKFTLDLSARYSDYKSVGSATTYKAGFDWAVDNILRLRGTAGTSFRAPALYELYLAGQTGYLSQLSVDPCVRWGAKDSDGAYLTRSATVRANCAADGIPDNYTGNGPSALITTSGGKYLRPETSYATTLGFVLTPPDFGLKLAMDFWKIKISDQIASSGAGVVGSCYASAEFRSKPGFCDLFQRDTNPASSTYLSITNIDGSYRNIPVESSAGIDYTASYEHTFNYGKLSSEAQFSWYKYDKSQLYPGGVVNQYTGLIGQPSWVGNVQTRFTHKDWTVTWTFNYTGSSTNIGYKGETGNTDGLVAYAPNANYAASTHPFVTHDLSLRYRGKGYEVIVGAKNAFDERAPILGNGVYAGSAGRLGSYAFSSQYADGIIGRQWYLHVNKNF
jgi:iron complex outermembrane receptor protein